jgi:hypothetical protein
MSNQKCFPKTNTLDYFALAFVIMKRLFYNFDSLRKCYVVKKLNVNIPCQQERQEQLFVTYDKSKISYGICP